MVVLVILGVDGFGCRVRSGFVGGFGCGFL